MVKGIIFDFDGVIFDGEMVIATALINYLKKHNIDEDIKGISASLGQTYDDIIAYVIKKYNVNDDFESAKSYIDDQYYTIANTYDFKAMPGLIEFLDKCKSKGIDMCIASSGDYSYLDESLKKINVSTDYFKFIVSGYDFVKSKPDPEIFLTAASKLNIDKENLIILEDSHNGIQAGIASGIMTYGFKGSSIVQDTSNADKEIYAFSEIPLD